MGVTPPSLAEPVTSVPPSVEVEDGTPASVRARLPYVCDRPLLTISLRDFETRKQEIGAQLVAAGRDVGFFYVVDALSDADVEEAFELAAWYHALPSAVKRGPKIDASNSLNTLGYVEESVGDGSLREALLVGWSHTPAMAGVLPEEAAAPGLRVRLEGLMAKLHAAALLVMRGIALGLGKPEDFFSAHMDLRHDDNASQMYINRYPSVVGRVVPDGALRIWAHSDYELCTLLLQRPGQAGLEVCPGKDSAASTAHEGAKWTLVDPVRGALTCNLGDSLQYWTEDALRATLHRVRVPLAGEYQGERFSVAYFANSRYSTVIQGEGARYPPVTFRQILDNKKAIAPKVNPDGRIDPAALLRFQQAGAFGPELSEDGRGAHPLRAGAAGA